MPSQRNSRRGHLVSELRRRFAEHELPIYASAIAFRGLISVIPLALLGLGLLGALGLQDTWSNSIAPAIRPKVLPAVYDGINASVDKIFSSSSAGLIVFAAAVAVWDLSLGMSEAFAGLVIVAIAGNAVENVVGVQLAARNRPDFAISVIVNSALQVALLLTPVLVFASLFFATELTLAFPTLLAISLLVGAAITSLVVYDGESTWEEGAILVGLYVVIGASFWWGA
jgi:Ca2+:H+ antiporter